MNPRSRRLHELCLENRDVEDLGFIGSRAYREFGLKLQSCAVPLASRREQQDPEHLNPKPHLSSCLDAGFDGACVHASTPQQRSGNATWRVMVRFL